MGNGCLVREMGSSVQHIAEVNLFQCVAVRLSACRSLAPGQWLIAAIVGFEKVHGCSC